jgi:hypothetical protein
MPNQDPTQSDRPDRLSLIGKRIALVLSYMSQTKSSSVFRGVHWDSKTEGWRAQLRDAHFNRRFRSEMEAMAHYNAVAKEVWPQKIAIIGTDKFNNPWDGRGESPIGWDHRGRRVIVIDRHFRTVVDENTYQSFKDWAWFVRDNAVLFVGGCQLFRSPPWVEFEYWRLDTMVLNHHRARQALPPVDDCIHINGHPLDNRICNLAAPDDNVQLVVGSAPVTDEGLAQFKRWRNSPRRKRFQRQLSEFLEYERQMGPGGTGLWVGEVPTDPRLDPQWREFNDM